VTATSLQRLARLSSPEVRIQTDVSGVNIELVDKQLHFHHSFTVGAIAQRARQGGQLLVRACNNRQRNIHTVLDLTAGWGVDGYILARHGQDVTLLEQNQLVQAIVAFSLQRLAADPEKGAFAKQLKIINAEALHFLNDLAEQRYDCIYLDPMFAAHKSGAKPAKEMQILQALTDNTAIETCFELALRHARKRVVVKRAAKASTLTSLKPDMVHRAKSVRFDVYQTT